MAFLILFLHDSRLKENTVVDQIQFFLSMSYTVSIGMIFV